MRCIHIYRGAPQLGGIKLHKHFPWFHTAKWGVHRIAPRTVLHVIRIVLTMELQPLKTVELHGWVCLPDSLVRNGSTSTIGGDYKRTHTHTHTHARSYSRDFLSCVVPLVLFGSSISFCCTERDTFVIQIHFRVIFMHGDANPPFNFVHNPRCEFMLFFHSRFQTVSSLRYSFKLTCRVLWLLSLFYLVKSHVIWSDLLVLFFFQIPIRSIMCFNLYIIA